MILSCSACNTRYLVDPSLLGPDGRVVRCAKCGHQWMQKPPEDLPRQVELPPRESEFRAIPGAPRVPGTNLPAFPPQPRPRSGAIAWTLLLLLLAGALGAAVLAREAVVAAWPPAARLYAAVGLPAEPPGAGLELRNVTSSRRVEGGTTMLVVEGEVANLSGGVREVPTMRGILKRGETEIQDWTFQAAQSRLLPGESASFVTSLRDPPSAATGLTITFTADN